MPDFRPIAGRGKPAPRGLYRGMARGFPVGSVANLLFSSAGVAGLPPPAFADVALGKLEEAEFSFLARRLFRRQSAGAAYAAISASQWRRAHSIHLVLARRLLQLCHHDTRC